MRSADEERHEMGNTLKEVLANVEGGGDDSIKDPENDPAEGADMRCVEYMSSILGGGKGWSG